MSENAAEVVLACRALCKSYREGPSAVRVLDALELEVRRGERLAIVGQSGSGKSTLLNMLGGLDVLPGQILAGLEAVDPTLGKSLQQGFA